MTHSIPGLLRSTAFRSAALFLLLLVPEACGPTGPNLDVDFPVFALQDIDCSAMGGPTACDFIGSAQDGIFIAGSHLCFVDHDMGYVLAAVDVGYPLNDVAATADGGYAIAVSDALFHYVSNDTYAGHEPLALGVSSPAVFLLARPQGGSAYVIHQDGSVTVINTLSWTVSENHPTDVVSPEAAAISSDGTAVFVADASDGTIKKLETTSFGTVSECGTGGSVFDMEPGPDDRIYAAVGCANEVWIIDVGTGQHYDTVNLPGTAVSAEVTPDGLYVFAGCPGYGMVVVDTADGSVEATIADYGVPDDMGISPNGHRALLCVESALEVYVLQD